MAEEQQKEKSVFEKNFTNILLSLISFAMISGITAIFAMNTTLVRIEERDKIRVEADKERSAKLDKVEGSINSIKLDIFDLKGKVNELERNDRVKR